MTILILYVTKTNPQIRRMLIGKDNEASEATLGQLTCDMDFTPLLVNIMTKIDLHNFFLSIHLFDYFNVLFSFVNLSF